ncbi:MAG TPA: glycosyltransferase family A protein [Miltoncostaeaceae bacterium]|nr:glycosyltransferase family A protein [Miltoncostaeaceae bacterium]
MTTLPVSVIIPAFNRAALLGRALESVAAQRPALPAEVIVVDDHSDDDTAAVARAHGATVIRHDRNRGAAAARNTALEAARQPWIAPLDSDDEWLPHHLATLWALRAGHVLVAGAAMQLGDHGSGGLLHGPDRDRIVRYGDPERILAPYNPIPASAVLVQRDAVLAAGGYDTGLRYAEDWDLWIRVLERGTAIQSPQVITRYHRHPGQKTASHDGPARAQRTIVDRYRSRPWCGDRAVARRHAAVAWDGLRRSIRERRLTDVLAGAREIASPRVAYEVGALIAHRRRLRHRSAAIAPEDVHLG